MRKHNRSAWIAAAAIAVGLCSSALAENVVIHAGSLLDGISRTPQSQVSILVQDERIVGVEKGFVTPAGSR